MPHFESVVTLAVDPDGQLEPVGIDASGRVVPVGELTYPPPVLPVTSDDPVPFVVGPS